MQASLTHQERCIRRKKMAEHVSKGNSVESTAKKFGVSRTTVADACAEMGISQPYSGNLKGQSSSELEVISKLLSGSTRSDVSRSMGVSKQYIESVVRRAEKSGIIKQVSVLAGAKIKL